MRKVGIVLAARFCAAVWMVLPSFAAEGASNPTEAPFRLLTRDAPPVLCALPNVLAGERDAEQRMPLMEPGKEASRFNAVLSRTGTRPAQPKAQLMRTVGGLDRSPASGRVHGTKSGISVHSRQSTLHYIIAERK
ncbi:MAG: hypothetical protein IJ702_08815 [Fretibacterium sp.]|nr:hypothetical protein [Fretibacterium sp.]